MSVNKVILVGRIGKDIELRKTPSGASVVNFTMATTEKFTDKQGQRQENTEWHNIVAWNKQADTIAQYCNKGDLFYIEGKLETRSWEDNGQKKYMTEIKVTNFDFIQPKGQSQGGGSFQQQAPQAPPAPQGGGMPPMQAQQAPAGLPVEDELPF